MFLGSSGLLFALGGIFTVIDSRKNDLSRAKSIVSAVSYTDKRCIDKTRFRRFRNRYRCRDVFYFKLVNSEENFAVRRNSEAYGDLFFHMKIGDTVKVFYRQVAGEYNTHVFQVEKEGKVVLDFKDYEGSVSTAVAIFVVVGLGIIIYSVMRVTEFNPFKFMKGLVAHK
jgi:hypothetical protein